MAAARGPAAVLPSPSQVYDPENEAQFRQAVERFMQEVAQFAGSTEGLPAHASTHETGGTDLLDHGSIPGLGDDDHTQYLLADGSRALSANWNAGAFEITVQALNTEGITLDQRTLTGAVTLDSTDFMVFCDASGGVFTVTLPDAAINVGQVYALKKVDNSANAVTIATTGGDTIDGAASESLGEQYRSLVLGNDGVNWFILAAERVVGSMIGGQSDDVSILAGTTRFMGIDEIDTSSTIVEVVIPFACTLRNFYVRVSLAPSAGESYTFTVAKNGTTGSVQAVISGTATSASDLSNTEIFAAGDRISIEIVTTAGAAVLATRTWSAELVRT